MPNYTSPGIYIESSKSIPVIGSSSSTVGGMLGVTQRGVNNQPVLLTSWNDYINNFAYGMDSPFLTYSDLAYAVYGFFQNGGKNLYVIRVTHGSSAMPASATFTGIATDVPVVNAKDVGTWGNSLTLGVRSTSVEGEFEVTVKYKGEAVETFEVNNTAGDAKYWIDVLNSSKYVTGVSGTLAVPTSDATFANGTDGIDAISSTDYGNALSTFDTVDDLDIICAPGQTDIGSLTVISQYAENRGDVFALIEAPKAAPINELAIDPSSYIGQAQGVTNCAVLYPYIRVADPLSTTGKLRDCPPSGHVMGVYARIAETRNIAKAPAGVEANIRGAVDVTADVSSVLGDLNTNGIIPIVSKTNYGIVLWGARDQSTDDNMKYVSDVRLDIFIKKSVQRGTQEFVFEPNNALTRSKLTTVVETFLNDLWLDGILAGSTAAEAYYVKCDDDINTADTINKGQLICEVGYAKSRPAEFIVFRFVQNIPSAN